MFNRCFTFCVIGIVMVLVGIGYKVYQDYAALEDILSETETALVKNTEAAKGVDKRSFVNRDVSDSLAGPQTVRQISPNKIGVSPSHDWVIGNPLKYNSNLPMDAVEFRQVKTPDGNTIEMPFPKADQIIDFASQSMGDEGSDGVRPVSFIAVNSKVPEGEDRYTFMAKNLLSAAHGISMEEVEAQLKEGTLAFVWHKTSSAPMSREEWIESLGGEEKVKVLFKDAGVPLSQFEQLFSPAQSTGHEIGFADRYDISADYTEVPERSVERAKIHHHSDNNQNGNTFNERPSASTENTRGETGLENQSTPEGIDVELSKRVSPERLGKARELIIQYGLEEGLRRLRDTDPEAARRFESDKSRPGRERRPDSIPDAPDSEESER